MGLATQRGHGRPHYTCMDCLKDQQEDTGEADRVGPAGKHHGEPRTVGTQSKSSEQGYWPGPLFIFYFGVG